MKRKLLLAASLTLVPGVAIAQEEPVLNVYNWSDYIAEDTIAKFEAETGIQVNYDVYDSNETLEARLLAGSSGYDVVVPTASNFGRQLQAGVYQPLNPDLLPNLSNMDPEIMAEAAVYDEGNAHSVVYMWGTTAFGYNVEEIEARMPDAPVDSWDMLFDPEVVSQFADCGVALMDTPEEVIPAALNYLGLDPNSDSAEDLAAAQELLVEIRPYIRYFSNSLYISDLANGEICLAMGYSGDILQSRDRAEEADTGIEIEYVIPEEGASIWFDVLAIPADAPHPENAHAFINFIMDPQIAADISNYVYYANANAASFDLVDEDVTSDPGIYPSDEIISRLYALIQHELRYETARTRAWNTIRTGQ